MSSLKRLRNYYAFLMVYLIIQIFLLTFLRSYNEDSQSKAYKILELYKKLAVRLNENTLVDNSGLYNILHLHTPEGNGSKFDITLVSQCSWNHIYSISDFFESWKGPLSVAVFTEADTVEMTLWEMSKLLHCKGEKKLALQLVVPVQDAYIKDFNYGLHMLSASDRSVSCKSFWFSSTKRRRNYNWSSEYPTNLLRNVAKSQSSTDYILMIDIDMVPSPDLRIYFLSYAWAGREKFEKVAYVVPIFETPVGVEMPQNKKELLELVKAEKARPFYYIPCENCQKATKYGEWLSLNKMWGTGAMFQVDWKHPWEPFFIVKRKSPDYDERFKQYGMNRVSHICELHVAGYEFVVMDNVFLVHKGYKTEEDFHDTKDADMEDSRKIYSRFKLELKYRYPGSKRKC